MASFTILSRPTRESALMHAKNPSVDAIVYDSAEGSVLLVNNAKLIRVIEFCGMLRKVSETEYQSSLNRRRTAALINLFAKKQCA